MALKSHSTRDEAFVESDARINSKEDILLLDTRFLVETTTKSQINW